MPYEIPSDVERLIQVQVATGKYRDADEVLREALGALCERDDDWAAIELALAELAAGDPGVEAHVVFDTIRHQHGAKSDA